MRYRVTLLPGDWVGPELVVVMQEIVAATGVNIEWEAFEIGQRAFAAGGPSISEEVLDSIRRNRVAFKTKHMTPPDSAFVNPSVDLRQRLQLFANVRPIRAIPGLPARWPDLDLVIVRENTEDIYAGIEHEVKPGLFESMKVTTEAACERIARFAFEGCREYGRNKVTTVHKSNIMKLSDGLFMRTAQRVAAEFPDIEHETIIADNMCMQLIQRPDTFDVVLAGNLFGDIISELCAGLVGGVSAVPGINRGVDCTLYECFHGDSAELVGRNAANPLPILMPAIHMLAHLGEKEAARRLFRAIRSTLLQGVKTSDLGGSNSTTSVRDAIIAEMNDVD